MRRAHYLSFFLLSMGMGPLACAWPAFDSGPAQPPTEVGEASADAGPDEPEPACPPAGGIAYVRPKPNVMLLVDRSGSMAEPGGCVEEPCASKWQQLMALGGYLAEVKQYARLGLSVFPAPGNDQCGTTMGEMVALTDAANVDQQILAAVSSVGPGGRTPIASALDELVINGDLADTDRENIVVLLTDGMPNCVCNSDADCEQTAVVEAVERMRALEVPIKLRVVGFGDSAGAASATLTAMAVAAGTERAGTPAYHQADTIEDLIGSLYEIAASLVSCKFNLDERPEPGNLVVHLDDEQVAACTSAPCASGYTYDHPNGVVELHGASCEALRDGGCHNVWFENVGQP